MARQGTEASRIYFISDVHLGVGTPDEERRKQQNLLALFERMQTDARALYIVGDLFDFWYEYRHVVPRGTHAILTALEHLAARIPVTYLAGNHDFAIGSFFTDIGIRIVRDDLSIEHDGRRFWVFHGDGLALRDGGYRALKRVLRSSVSQWLFRWLHPDLGFDLARAFSHGSRGYTSARDFGEHDGMRVEAARRIEAGADFVVMGHRHIPSIDHIGSGVYVNLGDWVRHSTYAVFEQGTMHLETMRDGDVLRLADARQTND